MEKYIGKQHLKRLGTGVGRSLPGLPQAKHGVRCAHQERRRGSPVISAVSWRVRRGHRQQQEQEQAQQVMHLCHLETDVLTATLHRKVQHCAHASSQAASMT
jgi:hypothetical protein